MAGMWGEINKGIQQVGATGMGLLKEQNDERYRQATLADSQARLNMAQAEAERNKLQFEHAEKKRLEQEAQENAYVPASMLYPDITNDKNTRKNFIETAKSAGYDIKETADGDVHAQGKAYKYIQGLMTSNAQFRTSVLKSKELDTNEKLTGLEQQSVQLAQEIMAARDSGKEPQKIAEMEAKQKQIRLAMSGVINSSADIQKTIEAEVRKQEQAKELKQMEIDAKPPVRPTVVAPGGVVLGPDNEPIYTAPNPILADRKLAREEAMEQRRQFHEENLAFRKDMMEINKEIRTRLPAAKAQELGSKTQTLSRYSKLADDFKDNFGGSYVGGTTMTEVYSRTGAKQDRVNWWKSFKMLDVQLRHDLFGATLTANEQKAWDAVTVSENSDPAIIKTAMNTRASIAKGALAREIDSYGTAGYNVNKFGYTEGPTVGTVVDGYTFKGGDPSKKENWEKR